ncbi:replication protein A 32 kDa subunit [Polyodon spathula]|uniref:replication protein A 32 kDa subunit n=1 Tax=Polyodon spathula TaxID=7913 RepID=UPI001B7EB48B|nr:replication protein A 32 kDa subunit [Polyodon spathula]
MKRTVKPAYQNMLLSYEKNFDNTCTLFGIDFSVKVGQILESGCAKTEEEEAPAAEQDCQVFSGSGVCKWFNVRMGFGFLSMTNREGTPLEAPVDVFVHQRSRAQSIVPCTVAQVLSVSQTEDVFRFGEVELSQVTLVGVIRHAEKAPTNIQYKLDDMTAPPIDVRQWVDTDEGGGENIVVPPGNYVKVSCHLRSFQSKKSLVAFNVRPLEDMNELTSHMLEVVHAQILLNKPQPVLGGGGMNQSLSVQRSMESGFSGAGDDGLNGLTPQQSQVLNLIKQCKEEQGISIHDIKIRLKGMNAMAVKQAVEFLGNEGHIYSTVDEDHFRSTEAGN